MRIDLRDLELMHTLMIIQQSQTYAYYQANNLIILGGDVFCYRMVPTDILMIIGITKNKIQLLIAGYLFSEQKSILATMLKSGEHCYFQSF